jgi:hypothetical protein
MLVDVKRWTFLFSLVALPFAALAIWGESAPLRAFGAWCALTAAWIAAAYAFAGPRALGKRADGSVAPWAAVLLAPYVLANKLVLRLVRLRGRRKSHFHEVLPGVFLGPRPVDADKKSFEDAGIRAVLDLTCEFDEPAFARRLPAYTVIPLLDSTAPSAEELAAAVRWCREQSEHGGVYIHCAAGRGRSATVVAALGIDLGHARDAEEAVALVRSRRPTIAPNGAQLAALRAWTSARKS